MSGSFGERVRFYRTERGTTQAALAAVVGRSHSMMSAIENGTRKVHVDELVAFADALNVPASALLGAPEADRFAEGWRYGYDTAMARVERAVASVREGHRPGQNDEGPDDAGPSGASVKL